MANFKKTALMITTTVSVLAGTVAHPAIAEETTPNAIVYSQNAESQEASRNVLTQHDNVQYVAQSEKPAGGKKVPNRDYSTDGVTPALPFQKGNPYGIKPGDTVQISNYRRSDFPICVYAFSCLLKPNVTRTVTSVTETSQGTKFTVDGMSGYDGHPIFKNGKLVGVTKGSNGGNGYGYLFPTEEIARANQVNYKPLRTGLFSRASYNNSGFPAAHDSSSIGSSSSSKKFTSQKNNAKEQSFASQNSSSWKKNGKKYLNSVEWKPGSKSFVISPKSRYTSSSFLLGLLSLTSLSSERTSSIPVEEMWKEAVSLGVPDTPSLKQQFKCHAQGSAIKKDNWSIEIGRPEATNQAYMNRAACNPS